MLNGETRPIIGDGPIFVEKLGVDGWRVVKEVINYGELLREHNTAYRDSSQRVVQYAKSGVMVWGME